MSLPESTARGPFASLPPRIRLGIVIFVCGLGGWGSAVWLRGVLFERAQERALAALLLFDAWSRSAAADGSAPELLEPRALEPDRYESALEDGKPAAKQARTPDAISVPESRVLEWIRNRKVPRGRAVAASPWLPAGISIAGISRFGLGLVESDRLVSVEGAPVGDPSEVISVVLAAFGRGASQISGEFVRATQNGPRKIRLTVHFPDASAIQAVLEELDKKPGK